MHIIYFVWIPSENHYNKDLMYDYFSVNAASRFRDRPQYRLHLLLWPVFGERGSISWELVLETYDCTAAHCYYNNTNITTDVEQAIVMRSVRFWVVHILLCLANKFLTVRHVHVHGVLLCRYFKECQDYVMICLDRLCSDWFLHVSDVYN